MTQVSINFQSFPFLLNIISAFLVIYSMTQIENNASSCECSITPKKRFIKEWFIIYIILNFINLFISIFIIYYFISIDSSQVKYIFYFLITYTVIIAIIHIIMIFRTFIYLNYLRTSCNCAYNLPEKILFWYFLIVICLFITLISILFIIGLLYLSSFKYR
jgi:hypothetical protein